MIKKSLIINSFLLLLCIGLLSFKLLISNCRSIKNGLFHFYQDEGQYHAIIIRKDSLQTEINMNTKDTSYWRVAWTSDCSFTMTYISGTKAKSAQELEFYKQSILKFDITNITEDYYTFNALLSYNNSSKPFSDTMWLHDK